MPDTSLRGRRTLTARKVRRSNEEPEDPVDASNVINLRKAGPPSGYFLYLVGLQNKLNSTVTSRVVSIQTRTADSTMLTTQYKTVHRTRGGMVSQCAGLPLSDGVSCGDYSISSSHCVLSLVHKDLIGWEYSNTQANHIVWPQHLLSLGPTVDYSGRKWTVTLSLHHK
ncbi:hypothetical protein ElyMa_000941800 [Elysia marginata]|uniref:FHA domain-containing protein n=1 Tax=Elysia marginata TaxID=1093978 RepID=A0AAV4HE64_9GAST|nr:hypothetical protein ElyMa_000941800 [Elysia marginata]